MAGWTVDNPQVTADSGYTTSGGFAVAFPNVPALPGVPPLARAASSIQLLGVDGLALADGSVSNLAESQILASQLGFSGAISFGTRIYSSFVLDALAAGALPDYAILDSNHKAVLTPDSTVEMDADLDSGIMSHPVEEGGFSAYNRVQHAIGVRLLLACQGKNMARDAFLATLRALREGTQLVTLVVPDDTYQNMALRGFGYRRTAEQGAVTIWAHTRWEESRSTGVTVSAPASQQPQGSPTTNLGALQPQAPTRSQSAVLANPPTVPTDVPARLIQEMPPSGAAF